MKIFKNSSNVMDLYMRRELGHIKCFAGSIIVVFVGRMKYAIVVLAMPEFVTTRCSAPMSLPLLIIYNEIN